MMARKGKVLKFANVIINTILLILSLLTIIDSLFPDAKYMIAPVNIVSVVIIVLQAVGVFLSHEYEKIVEQKIFNMSKGQVYEKIKPYPRKNIVQYARDELRFGLHILLFVVILVYMCLCIRFQNALLFFVGTGLVLLAYMYADYIPHSIYYAKLYDKGYISEKEKENSTRGLARIYLEEYKITKFDRKHSFYKDVSFYNFEDDRIQDSCIKHILFMQVDSIRCPEIVYGILLMVVNWFLVVPNLFENIIKEFVGEVNADMPVFKIMIGVAVNVIFAIINIIISVTYEQKCEEIKALSDVINSTRRGSRNKRFDKYEECRKSKSQRKFEIIRSRGVFVYCSTLISQGRTLEEIPLKYRMLYTHKYYANIPRFRITAALLISCMMLLLFEYDMSISAITFWLLLDLLAAILFSKFILPNFGKRSIAKKCRELIGYSDYKSAE